MINRRTFREWLEDARDDWRRYGDFAFALGMIAVASFIGASAARLVFS